MSRRITLIVGTALSAVVLAGAGMLTNGLPFVAAGPGAYSNLEPGQLSSANSSNCCGPLVATDTNRQGGAAPQSVAATPYQIAATMLEGLTNALTSTAGAATGTTLGGVVTTEALATAAGSNYVFTLTNALITAAYVSSGNVPQVGIYSVTNTGGTLPTRTTAQMTLLSTTVVAGSVVWTWRDDGNTALNGTMRIAWHL